MKMEKKHAEWNWMAVTAGIIWVVFAIFSYEKVIHDRFDQLPVLFGSGRLNVMLGVLVLLLAICLFCRKNNGFLAGIFLLTACLKWLDFWLSNPLRPQPYGGLDFSSAVFTRFPLYDLFNFLLLAAIVTVLVVGKTEGVSWIRSIWFLPLLLNGLLFFAKLIAFIHVFREPGILPQEGETAVILSVVSDIFYLFALFLTTYWLRLNCHLRPYEDRTWPIAGHILLLLFSLGIWNHVWIYRTTRFLNRTENEPTFLPDKEVVLCLFVPFYHVYWIYKQAQKLDQLTEQRGLKKGPLRSTCLFLGIFLPLVADVLMQDRINDLILFPAPPKQQAPEEAPALAE